MHDGGRRAIVAALIANFGIAVAKLAGFLVTGAASMLAEAVHSAADTSNQALLLFGNARAKREATTDHPFGYGRERYFWAFVVALVLFLLGGVFALYEGIEKLRHPHELESLTIAVVILVVAIGLESFSLRTAVKEAAHAKGSAGWWTFIRRSKSPELPVVLLEDVGALLGLVIALVGVTLGAVTDNARWDAAGSLAIGILLIVIAVTLVIEMKSLLIGEAASATDEQLIAAALVAAPGVRSVIHMRTQHIGPDELLVAAKLEMAPQLVLEQLTATIDDAEQRVRAAVASARLIYLEPDIRHP